MKTRKIFLFSITATALILSVSAVSCRKAPESIPTPVQEESFPEGEEDGQILFLAEGIGPIDVGVETKATVVTALSTFQASATKGSAGSETSKWANVTFTSDGAGTPTYHGGKYWPDSDESYHFYAANSAISFAAAGSTITTTSNGTDIVYAYMASPTYGTKNTLTFNHAYARIGDVKVAAASGYTISGITVNITPKTHGTFNMRTAAWSSTTNGSATNIANASPGTKSNDLYLLPGNYRLQATWTATRDDYSHAYSNISATADVSIEIGKINKINITLGGNATEITFGVTVNPWTNSSEKDVTFPTS